MALLTEFVLLTISTEKSFRIGISMYYHEETVKASPSCLSSCYRQLHQITRA